MCRLDFSSPHLLNHPEPDELLPLPEEDEAGHDVGGHHVQVAKELGEDAGNVGEGVLGKKIYITVIDLG